MIGSHSSKLVSVNRVEDAVLSTMRAVEELMTFVIDVILFFAKGFIHWMIALPMVLRFGIRKTALGNYVANFEYYIDDEGKLKARRYSGMTGTWKRIDGKLVHTSFDASYDDMTFMGWNSQCEGYDEALGYVSSKSEYRKLMKEKGFVPKESFAYSKKTMKQRMEERISARNKDAEYKNFMEVVKRTEAQTGFEFY